MKQKSLAITHAKRKETSGDRVRGIAARLQEETEVQIKATSRILAAAAQISENHDRLIGEVVDMVEEDLDKQNRAGDTNEVSIEMLKKRFSSLERAKCHFGLKANSWANLVSKLNNSSSNKPTAVDQSNNSIAERLDAIESKLSDLRGDMNQVLSLLRQLTADKD